MTKGKILIIDDSPLVRKLAEVSLQEAGYEVFTAENGEEGLKIAEKEIPDLILVDFIMPKMTGSQFCILLKENEKLKDIPILLVTGKGETVGQAFIEKYGVQDYFIKPFKSEDLVEKVQVILEKILLEEKEISIEIPSTEKIPEISETDLKLILDEESLIPEKPLEKIEIPTTEEIFSEIPEEKPIEFSFLDKIEEAPVETSEEIFEKEIEPASSQENIASLLSEGTELSEKSLIEITPEELTFIPEEIIEEKVEDLKATEESLELPVSMEKTQPQEFSFVKEEISASKLENIERILENKLNEFYNKINNSIKDSIESSLKKFGIIKEDKIILAGKTSKWNPKNLIEFISESKLTGFLTFFEKNGIFEFLLIEGKIVYGIASTLKSELGNKFLKDFTTEEIKRLTIQTLDILMKTEISNFILEERDKAITYLDTLPRYDIKEVI